MNMADKGQAPLKCVFDRLVRMRLPVFQMFVRVGQAAFGDQPAQQRQHALALLCGGLAVACQRFLDEFMQHRAAQQRQCRRFGAGDAAARAWCGTR